MIILIVLGTISHLINRAAMNDDTSIPTIESDNPLVVEEETYTGITKQIYLDKVSDNGKDMGMHCAYEYLIDNYGIKETVSMDMRADKDANDLDPRFNEAMDVCF